MTKIVMMPRELTAENGAKAAMMGEFYIELTVECEKCEGMGDIHYEPCGACDETGERLVKKIIPWDIIKAIYKKAVEVCGV